MIRVVEEQKQVERRSKKVAFSLNSQAKFLTTTQIDKVSLASLERHAEMKDAKHKNIV